MCIIIHKPKNIPNILEDHINNAWNNHNDGAGYALRFPNNQIVWKKGFLKLKNLKKSLDSWPLDIIEKSELTIHFRTGTSGGKSQALTHPFPINEKKLLDLSGENETLLFHNGILSISLETGLSDTATLAKNLIDLDLDSSKIQSLLTCIFGHDKAILILKNETLFFGKWEIDKGVSYSNASYKYFISNMSRFSFYKPYSSKWDIWEKEEWEKSYLDILDENDQKEKNWNDLLYTDKKLLKIGLI